MLHGCVLLEVTSLFKAPKWTQRIPQVEDVKCSSEDNLDLTTVQKRDFRHRDLLEEFQPDLG